MNPDDNARDIDEELAFHRERTVADLVERGLTAAQAEAEADRRFGPAAATTTLLPAFSPMPAE